ncbi:FtsX-like permease family [Acididesulfobacillus acetoxydans]|uniref:Cell division protein FtsX n=1 Tax=Acididesulfobacillus acetoxydans TaxID=1561005 RepID=A0A8S0WVL9_9FIRM|nr:permease-like cell division protein FtsX [Acididesulfobacillus acetoxydans]CAA7599701.1 FtsX-like permease family [Acididesulfobacillus acetoxydans]CEJ06253.1 Cell division protein FtsX [Acididesulfobacillus acetoxydans]
MSFSSAKYVLRETLSSVKRNPWLSIASVMTVMVSLIILGFSAFFLANTSNMAQSFESQVEISAFVHTNVPETQVEALETKIKAMPGVASVVLVTKKEGLAQFGQSLGKAGGNLVSDLGGTNPLPDKFTIKAADPRRVKTLAAQLQQFTELKSVRYGQGVVDRLLQFTRWLRWMGAGVIIAFGAAAVVLISINIKMNVFSRRREIQIMKLVGASNWFIRWPFLVEGLFLGLAGGILATVLVGTGYNWLAGYVSSTLAFLPVVRSAWLFWQVQTTLLVLGMVIGAAGSALSLRKFLNV